MEKTTWSKDEKKRARLAYANLKEVPARFESTRQALIDTFSESDIPNWGGMIFNGQRI